MKKSVRRKGKTLPGYSLKTRIAYALFALVAIQGLILICAIGITDVIGKNNIVTYNTLCNQAHSRKNEIQNQFNTKRINIANLSAELGQKIEDTLAGQGISLDELSTDSEAYAGILELALAELIGFTKYTSVTGVFMVFDPTPQVADTWAPSRASMYIRDFSPGIIAENNSNLLLEYGRVDIARNMGIAVDSLWIQHMRFDTAFNRDFYFKPVNAALENAAEGKPHLYGYWSPPFVMRADDVPVIMYSLPLVVGDGRVCGVIGFELDLSYVGNLLPANEVPFARGAYLLGVDAGQGLRGEELLSSGAYAKQFLSGVREYLSGKLIYESEKAAVYRVARPGARQDRAIGAYSQIDLYETVSPFYQEKWQLVCMAPQESVMYGSDSIKNAITLAILITTLLALAFSFLVSDYIFSPIRRLAQKVKSIDPEKPVRFTRTTIREIDELSGAFEVLSDSVSEAAVKMFKIIELVGMPLGSFEIIHNEDKVYLSRSLFRLLNFEAPPDCSYISAARWYNFLKTLRQESLTESEDGVTETLYVTEDPAGGQRWFRVRRVTEKMRVIGVLIDVTQEITRKQRVEFERDHDSLTKLLNRQAFLNRSYDLMSAADGSLGIMMFADLDGLKTVNDAYGHETGDAYIRSFAQFLRCFEAEGAAVGRVAGDEFAVFMCGFNSCEQGKQFFEDTLMRAEGMIIVAPDGAVLPVRVSAGLACYPQDADNIKELLKYADFAMYKVKNAKKLQQR